MIFFVFFCWMKPYIFASFFILYYMLSSEYDYSTSWNESICITGHSLALFKYNMSHINIQLWPSLLVLLLFLLLLLLLGLSCILSIKCLYTWISICLSIFQVLQSINNIKECFFMFKRGLLKNMLSTKRYFWRLVYNLIKPI